jgi:hypothetical protein
LRSLQTRPALNASANDIFAKEFATRPVLHFGDKAAAESKKKFSQGQTATQICADSKGRSQSQPKVLLKAASAPM